MIIPGPMDAIRICAKITAAQNTATFHALSHKLATNPKYAVHKGHVPSGCPALLTSVSGIKHKAANTMQNKTDGRV
jgi:hypothetical protein